MKKTIYCLTFPVLAVLGFAACDKTAALEETETGTPQRMHVIPSMAAQAAGITQESEIGTFMLKISGAKQDRYNYYVAMKKENGTWKSYSVDGEGNIGNEIQMLWSDASSPVTAAAIFHDGKCVKESAFDEFIVKIDEDQSTEEKLKKNDILYMTPFTARPTDHSDGGVDVEFSHLLAKIHITITLDDEFNKEPGTAVNPVESVTVNDIDSGKAYYICEGTVGLWGTPYPIEKVSIKACPVGYTPGELGRVKAVTEYECLITPDRIGSGYFKVRISINGKEYEWASESDNIFKSNHSYELPLKVGKGMVELASPITVTEWSEDTLPDGGTDEDTFAVWDGTVTGEDDIQGTGTETDPYIISSGADLACIAKAINSGVVGKFSYSKHYLLTRNIDLAGIAWTPVGYQKNYMGNSFVGVFDGNGKTIRNLKVDMSGTEQSAGLFGSVNSAKIKDLTITDADVTGDLKVGILAGTITQGGGSGKPEVTNCHVSGKVSKSDSGEGGFGGLFGDANYVTANNCTADVTIDGRQCSGAFAGISFICDYTNCTVRGSVSGVWSTGGFSGAITYGGYVEDCISYANVTATDWNCGGFVGYFAGENESNAPVAEGCKAYGTVTSNLDMSVHHAGGFAGYMSYAEAQNCIAGGEVKLTYPKENSQAGTFLGFDEGYAKTEMCSYISANNKLNLNTIGNTAETTSSHDITAR